MDVLDAEAGGKQGNLDLLLQFRVFRHTKFGFEVAVEAVHKVFYFIHFAHHQFMVGTVGDIKQYFLRVEDVVIVQQRRMLCILDGFADSAFAFAVTGTHNGYPTIFHDCFYIVEVEVDDASHSDDFSNALGCNQQGVVCFGKCAGYGEVWIDFTQFFIVDDKQRIYVFTDFFYTV